MIRLVGGNSDIIKYYGLVLSHCYLYSYTFSMNFYEFLNLYRVRGRIACIVSDPSLLILLMLSLSCVFHVKNYSVIL